MGLLKSLGDFLFGKDPDIFDSRGDVRHNLPETKWKEWDDRIRANPNFDFRYHKGQAKEAQPDQPKDDNKH